MHNLVPITMVARVSQSNKPTAAGRKLDAVFTTMNFAASFIPLLHIFVLTMVCR